MGLYVERTSAEMVRMTLEERRLIVSQRYDLGLSADEIAKIRKLDRRQVYRVLRKWKLHGTVENRPRRPRSRVTTPVQDRAIVRMADHHPHRKPRQVRAALQLHCSLRTIRNRWKECGRERHHARKKWWMSDRHAQLRHDWARVMLTTRVSDWNRVLWCDEKTFRLGVYGVEWVTRRPGTAYAKKNLAVNDRYAGKVQVSISISAKGKGAIEIFEENMKAEKYISILRDSHLPAARRLFGVTRPWHLVHDNDRKHTAKSVRKFLQDQKVRVLPWPAKSPDLNLVENTWARLTSIVHDINPKNTEELRVAVRQAWDSLETDYLVHLVQSVPTRLQAVVDADGWQTKY